MKAFQSPANGKMVELSRRETEQIQGGILLVAIQKCSSDARSTSTDDVYVEGRIITAENYDSAY